METTVKKEIYIDDGEHLNWYSDAKNLSEGDLVPFIRRLMTSYSHDLNTVCHAMVAIALAAIKVANDHEEGGISSGQAKIIAGEFVKRWMCIEDDGPLVIKLWNAALLVENKEKIVGVPGYVVEYLQKVAKHFLSGDMSNVSDEQKRHLERVAEGNVFDLPVIREE